MQAKRICPVCNKEYSEAPALSRAHRGEMICGECGTMEALDDARHMIGAEMNDEEWKNYKGRIIEMMRER
ncbi:MAG: hypothetical protein PHR92_16135 [Lachnospiraceae bacterium]|nr:hypothetical protein [Lachnospiraceae bacterium]